MNTVTVGSGSQKFGIRTLGLEACAVAMALNDWEASILGRDLCGSSHGVRVAGCDALWMKKED